MNCSQSILPFLCFHLFSVKAFPAPVSGASQPLPVWHCLIQTDFCSKKLLKRITCLSIFFNSTIVGKSKNGKQPKFSSMVNFLNKSWYSHTMECFGVAKRSFYTCLLAFAEISLQRGPCDLGKGDGRRLTFPVSCSSFKNLYQVLMFTYSKNKVSSLRKKL